MFGAGKKTYNLLTTDRGTGREQINKSLPKELQNALRESKYKMQREDFKKQMDEKTQEIEKENENLKALEESDDRAEIDKTKEKNTGSSNRERIFEVRIYFSRSVKFRCFTERD